MAKISVRCVRLNSGGYNSRGRYFGIGGPLYSIEGEEYYGHVRACDRVVAAAFAREHVRQKLRHAICSCAYANNIAFFADDAKGYFAKAKALARDLQALRRIVSNEARRLQKKTSASAKGC